MCASRVPQSGNRRGIAGRTAIICFSHLRWSFVWQRPQHLLSRFAATYPVYLVEEPEFLDGVTMPTLSVKRDRNATILTPVLPAHSQQFGFNVATNPVIRALLTPFFAERGLLDPTSSAVAWYYTPMALGAEPFGLRPVATIYDVMDELANFLGAPAHLRENEHRLYDRADLVFAGGPSLYHARIGKHPRVHCFPSGVDVSHFAQARDITALPTEIAGLSRPILGYYGVLDERVDTALIEGIATHRPDWHLVLIGPVAKISESDLPQAANIHYLGKREYDELPSYLAGFDAAILPFARNDATRFISPTKTLEYLAGGKPVVSTSIQDVVDLYGSVVEFADDPESFAAAVERHWSEPVDARGARQARARRLLAEHQWDAIADQMLGMIEDVIALGTRPDVENLTQMLPLSRGASIQTTASD